MNCNPIFPELVVLVCSVGSYRNWIENFKYGGIKQYNTKFDEETFDTSAQHCPFKHRHHWDRYSTPKNYLYTGNLNMSEDEPRTDLVKWLTQIYDSVLQTDVHMKITFKLELTVLDR